jgi:polyhydroxybutyrate depolymerase
MRGATAAALALIVALAGPGPAAARDGAAPAGARDVARTLDDGGRRYLLHVPPDPGRRTPVPILVALHAAGSSAAQFQRYARLDRVADREGFLVTYPEGAGDDLLSWNAGDCCGDARQRGVDDVGFVLAVLRDVAREWPVDRTRVYVTGHSNGAMMAHRVAAEMPERVAAIAAVAGVLALDRFAPTRPVPVLHIHSVDDSRELYGRVFRGPLPLTSAHAGDHPVEFQLGRWVDRDACRGPADIIERRASPAMAGRPAQTATRIAHRPCASSAEVQLWRLTGVGHGWPGADTEVQSPQGPPTNLIDAAEEAWRFLERYSRPDAPPLS